MKTNQLYQTIHITKHSGKLTGIDSISTSCLENKQCKHNQTIEESVCKKCYACRYLNMRKALRERLSDNRDLLINSILPGEQLPTINARYFRFESFGDLENANQVINYFNICHKNPGVNFSIWTKNPRYIHEALTLGYKKPSNLIILYSSLFLNQQISYELAVNLHKYNFIDKVFTVYDKNHIKNNNIEINCGGKKCLDCLLCYTKNDTFYINELLK